MGKFGLEDKEEQIRSTRSWRLSGQLFNDLYVAILISRGQEVYMHQQLEQTSRRREKREEANFIKTGKRSYPMLEASSTKCDMEYLKEVSALLFDEDAWLLLEGPTEVSWRRRWGEKVGTCHYRRSWTTWRALSRL